MVEMIQVYQGDDVILPVVTSGIQWTTSRIGTAGRLTFSTLQNTLRLGATVTFYHQNEPIFMGRIFSVSGGDGDEVKYTAYDNTYYFKNVDTYSYENQTIGDIIKYICEKISIPVGDIANTSFDLTQVEENSTYWDMILNAVNMTVMKTGEYYIFYDDFGKIKLVNNADQTVNFLLDEETCIKFDYSSDIVNSFNSVILGGTHQAIDSGNIEKWGLLSMLEDDDNPTPDKVKALLSLHNRPTRTFTAEATADLRVRAGSIFPVNIGGFKTFFIADEVTHKIDAGTMSLKIVGGGGEIT